MSRIFKFKKPEGAEKKISQEEISSKPTSVFNVSKPQEVFKKEHEVDSLDEENTQRDIERSQARSTSRVGERILGFPGDIKNFISSFLPEELKGLIGIPLPGSHQLQEFSEKASGGYTTPKNEIEKKTDEIVGDIGSMMIPGGPGYSMSRNIGIPLVGAAVKEGLEGRDDADLAKAGTMFLLDLITGKRAQIATGRQGLGGAQNYINSLFRQAEQSLPAGAHYVDVSPMIRNLQQQRAILLRGGRRPSANASIERIDQLIARAPNGQMDIHEFMPARSAINEIIETLGGWNFEQPPAIRNRSIANLNRVKRSVINAGENYGQQMNPQFLESWRSANEGQAVLSRSNVVSNFVKRTLGRYALHPITKTVLGLGTGASSLFKPSLGVIAGTGGGIYQAGKFLYRIYESPTLRRFYTNAIRGAINGQKSILSENAEKFDRQIKKEEKDKKNKKESVFQD